MRWEHGAHYNRSAILGTIREENEVRECGRRMEEEKVGLEHFYLHSLEVEEYFALEHSHTYLMCRH